MKSSTGLSTNPKSPNKLEPTWHDGLKIKVSFPVSIQKYMTKVVVGCWLWAAITLLTWEPQNKRGLTQTNCSHTRADWWRSARKCSLIQCSNRGLNSSGCHLAELWSYEHVQRLGMNQGCSISVSNLWGSRWTLTSHWLSFNDVLKQQSHFEDGSWLWVVTNRVPVFKITTMTPQVHCAQSQ